MTDQTNSEHPLSIGEVIVKKASETADLPVEAICAYCGEPLKGKEIVTKNKIKLHLKPCFREMQKDARRLVQGTLSTDKKVKYGL